MSFALQACMPAPCGSSPTNTHCFTRFKQSGLWPAKFYRLKNSIAVFVFRMEHMILDVEQLKEQSRKESRPPVGDTADTNLERINRVTTAEHSVSTW